MFIMLKSSLILLVLVIIGNAQLQLSFRPSQVSPIPRATVSTFKNRVFFPSLPPAQRIAPLIRPKSLPSPGTFSPSPQVQDIVVGLGSSGKEIGDFLASGWAGLRQQRHILPPKFSPTAAPILVTPTTIRFTLNDAQAPTLGEFRPSWHPPMPLEIRPQASQRSSTKSVSAISNAPFTKLLSLNTKQVENFTTKSTITKPTILPTVQRHPTITLGGFRPSSAFPFLSVNSSLVKNQSREHPSIKQNNHKVSDSNVVTAVQRFRQPKALNFFGSESNIFSVRSTISPSLQKALVLAKELASNSIILKSKQNLNQSSFLTVQSEVKETENNEKTTTKQPERKTFHFNEDFLALLKRNTTPIVKAKPTTTKTPSTTTSEVMPFWFRIAEEASLTRKWRLKGGARAPATQPTSKTTLISNSITRKAIGKSLGITISSSDDSEVSIGPRVVPLGVQGEVGHAEEGPSGFLAPIMKHGVQSLNVSAWVSGCPKLYGEVELRCTVDHDPVMDNQMTMMWKKKSYSLGVPEEKLVSLDEALVVQDTRFSLKNGKDHSYSLHIRDFRPSDCGTYECQAKAKQATAASQLLLFTCL
ncbi:unnamed protein product [Meganyctiphanes norvegica]|uniref:Ig-like domain-containing protein n=1 Tax=Meganyctiphanes norvegica TaxID=48144 RepID=A0AAV2PY07_MEGNR